MWYTKLESWRDCVVGELRVGVEDEVEYKSRLTNDHQNVAHVWPDMAIIAVSRDHGGLLRMASDD